MKKKIYLSAPALVCCAGQNRNELYESCLAGFQGGLADYAGSFAAEAGNESFAALALSEIDQNYPTGLILKELPEVYVPQPLAYTGKTKIIRIINEALEQLRTVVENAVLKYGGGRIGVCLGSCDIGSESAFLAQHELLNKDAQAANGKNFNLQLQSASYCAEFISQKFGVCGPAFGIATACASGANAVVRGAELIQAGVCDAVIAGGADAVTNTIFAGFLALEAISNEVTNPFSKNRKGINLGEGAAFFLMEADKNSNVELLGSGESVDAYHMTAPKTDGTGQAKAMENALLSAGIKSSQIGYVNLHGTGTELNDKTEFLAMKNVFAAEYPGFPPASSTKPITGHTLGASGALEAAICWMVLNERKGLPVHCWDGEIDEQMPFVPIKKSSLNGDDSSREEPSICMSNSFGFGGCNVSLILGRCP